MAKSLKVTQETSSGKNVRFKDTSTGANYTLNQLIHNIKNEGYYSKNYYVNKTKNGNEYIASKPDRSEKNNLE